ncbi:MAG: hypothetical protein U0324_44010 [Polyangiales bacterium]
MLTSPLDYMLALALSLAGLQVRTAGEAGRAAVRDAHGLLFDSLGSAGLVRMRAATLSIRALLLALAECDAANVSALARSLARTEALTAFRALLDGAAPPDPRGELARAWAAWRAAPKTDEGLRLAHAALRVGALYAPEAAHHKPIGDLTGQRLARELGRADLLGEADGPGSVSAAPEGPVAPAGRAPRARLEVV